MAHNIHRRLDGTHQAMYVGKPAWHSLGEVRDAAMTAKEVYVEVFRKRVIETVPAFARMGGKYVEVPETRFTADRALGVIFAPVSAEYRPIQDIEPLKMVEAIVKASKRKAGWVSAFSLGNGARNAATLDLTRVLGEKALQVARDQSAIEAFIVADWSHDGTGALKIMDALNRVDCQNMLNAANLRAEARGKLVRIVHSGDVEAQMHEAERILGFAVESTKLSVKLLNDIASLSVPKPDAWFRDFTELLVPIPDEMERKGTRIETRHLLEELWQRSPNLQTVPKGPYRGLQAVTEYADHFRPLRISDKEKPRVVAERRFRSLSEGPASDLKSRAVELIRQEFEVKVPA